MFRNGPEMDGGDTAYLGPTTIIEMTIPVSQSSSDATLDDSWVLAEPINYLYRLDKEADNMIIAISDRAGAIDNLFTKLFLSRDWMYRTIFN